MRQLIKKIFRYNRYNEIVQCPSTGHITTTHIVGGITPMGL